MTKLSALRSVGLSVLTCERVYANGYPCSECGDRPEDDGTLLIYSTVVGTRSRRHDGMFCSKQCHDQFHQLAPRGSARA